MKKGAEFQIMVGMQVGDEDQAEVFKVHALINQPAGDAQSAIDNDLSAVQFQKAGGWHG